MVCLSQCRAVLALLYAWSALPVDGYPPGRAVLGVLDGYDGHLDAVVNATLQQMYADSNIPPQAGLMIHHSKISTQEPFRMFITACDSIEMSASFLLNVTCQQYHYVNSLFEYAQIPHVSLTPADCLPWRRQKFSLSSQKTDLNAGMVIQGLLNTMNTSKRLFLLYDDSVESHQWFDRMIMSFGQNNWTISLHHITMETIEDAVRLMKRPAEYAWPYLVLCKPSTILRILHYAYRQLMRRLEFKWIIYGPGLDRGSLLPLLVPTDNIALIEFNRNESISNHEKIQNASRAIAVVYNRAINGMQGTNISSSSPEPCKSALDNKLRDVILKDLKVVLEGTLSRPGNRTEYNVYSSVTRQDGHPKLVNVAAWQSSSNYQYKIKADKIFPNAFHGFNNRTFNITTKAYSFFQRKIVKNGTVRWEGLTFEILNELARDLNFSYNTVEPPDDQWGIEEDGRWTGMMGQVVRKEVDFAAASFSITAAREAVADFPSPYYHDRSVVVLRRPDEDNKILLYTYPFHSYVWLAIASAIIVVGILLWIFTNWDPTYDAYFRKMNSEQGFFTLRNSVLYIYGTFCQQGGQWLPRSQPGRILVGTHWFFVIVMVATYTGNLIAFLAVSTVQMPFNDLTGMVAQSTVSYGTSVGVALVMLFRDASFEPYTTVYQNMEKVSSYPEGLRRVKKGTYAFIAEKSWYYEKSSKDCSLAMIKEEFYPTNYAWALQSGAPYLRQFSDRINKLRESGLLHKWIQKWTPKNLQCKGLGPITQAKVATIKDFQGAFYLLLIGIGVATCALVVEVVLMKKKKAQLTVEDTTMPVTDPVVYVTGERVPNGLQKHDSFCSDTFSPQADS